MKSHRAGRPPTGESLLRVLLPMGKDPGGAFRQVAHLDALLKRDGIGLELAVEVLRSLRIHPWSLLGGYGDWEEVQRDWGLRLGIPASWVAALGPRPRRGPADAACNPAPNAFRIPVDLGLEHLPEGLRLKNLEVRHCPRLEGLGPALAIQENLALHGCERLETLPGDLEVGGRLSLSNCSSLREVGLNRPPRDVVLADDVALREIRLPAAFQGSLCLKGCDELRTLVLPSATLENLYLDGCHFLGPVPVKQVRRGVRMECQEGGTTCLPPGVRIGGSARLGFLRDGPVELPTGLRIGADLILDLAFASGVSLPPDAQVDGSLYLSNAYPGWNRTESIPAHLRVVAFGGYDELPSFPDWEG